MLLELTNIHKYYNRGSAAEVHALRGVNLKMRNSSIASNPTMMFWMPLKILIFLALIYHCDNWIVPLSSWHLRIHRIETARPIDTAEGGYAFAWRNGVDETPPEVRYQGENSVAVMDPQGISGLLNRPLGRTSRTVKWSWRNQTPTYSTQTQSYPP